MERMAKDERFAHIINDARFKSVPSKRRKVKIDKRFKSMFKDSNFKVKYTMDSKGRPLKHTSSEELRKFYEISSSSESEDDGVTASLKENGTITKKEDKSPRKETEVEELNSVDKDIHNNHQKKDAKGSCDSVDSDSSHRSEKNLANVGVESGSTSSEESDLENLDDEFDHQWGELHADAPEIDQPTSRFAICNMDWDRMKAEDLFVLLNSFKPPDRIIRSVKIYPSEFGIQRIKEEEIRGPKELVEESLHSGDEDEERSVYHREKLRKYQINRLKYYFAIVECDSPETASLLYEELDGMEYESSASCLDLRFVPDDMTFEQEPSSVATSMPNMSSYKPILFTTSAFQQVKVNLTWDETDPRRAETMKNLFTEDDPNIDVSTYLATSSEDEELEENIDENSIPEGKVKDKVSKYKELLQSLESQQEKDRGDVELEITWEPGLKKAAEDLIKEKQKKSEEATPWEQYLQKRKERRKQKKKQNLQDHSLSDSNDDSEDNIVSKESDRGTSVLPEDEKANDKEREMLELLAGDDKTTDDLKEVQEKKKLRKKKKQMKLLQKAKKQESKKVDVQDSRFSAIYTNPLYNIDPSDSHYKGTEGMKAFVEEKQRKMKKGAQDRSHDNPTNVIFQETKDLATTLKTKLLKSKRRRLQQ